MIRFLCIAIFLVLFLICSIPLLILEWIIGHFNMDFKKFVNLFRFESACKLLSERNRSIADVGICCGFGSIRNFNRVFKSICGYTPGQYRKQTDSQ